MKPKHKQIISFLRKDSRTPLTKISRKTSIPVSTLHEMVKKNILGIIKKKTILLDFEKLGYKARAKFLVKVNKGEREALRQFLESNKNTNTLQATTNGYDFIADLIFKDFKEMHSVFTEINDNFNIQEQKKLYIIEDIKNESFLEKFDYFNNT
jgi:Lrp/AsnC family leucine-responsive transcriptional regulator